MDKQDKAAPAVAASVPAATQAAVDTKIPRERALFRALLAGNPNFFGNVANSPLPPSCPSRVTRRSRRSAVSVSIRSRVGLTPSSSSRSRSATAATSAPRARRNVCASTFPSTTARAGSTKGPPASPSTTCLRTPSSPSRIRGGSSLLAAGEVLPLPQYPSVRAILSWDHCPPPNRPDWTPVWGEVHDTYIQVQPRRKLPWWELFNDFKVKLPPEIAKHIDLDQEAQVKTPPELSLAQPLPLQGQGSRAASLRPARGPETDLAAQLRRRVLRACPPAACLRTGTESRGRDRAADKPAACGDARWQHVL